MLLAIDVGNTATILGLWDEDRLLERWRIATDPLRMESEYAVLFRELFDQAGLGAPDAAIVSSVVPPVEYEIELALDRLFGVRPLLVDARSAGLDVDLENPAEVGADRLVNAVAALAYGDPRGRYVVVDFGTATTFDLVEAPNVYRGGAIAPGPRTAAEALSLRTAKLPRVDLARPPARAVGRSTADALRSGLILGYASLVDGMVRRFLDEAGAARVIATGGFARTVERVCETLDVVDDDLTLKGLRIIWEKRA
ncbi:type III pantothenate kinase [Oceanithermus profundus]|uniref:Type III pantothenate kinase n=1 Tax=Oceanithermus profundus (strain DSM 14977 / NBRC 100410 / VKM B-2274 / 506) TaxID=670487 RepID=E4U932_OCEP5|nr:type III pantothenate kinase [Oceanithermus profundus]ADR36862.1 pantothenate kinase [Oceanithermus profundus DSM 14977]